MYIFIIIYMFLFQCLIENRNTRHVPRGIPGSPIEKNTDKKSRFF